MPTRLVRSFKMVSNTLNDGSGLLSGCSCKCRSRFCVMVCTAQKVPVRPIPALQCTKIGPRRSCIASTRCSKCRNVAALEGSPWSGHSLYLFEEKLKKLTTWLRWCSLKMINLSSFRLLIRQFTLQIDESRHKTMLLLFGTQRHHKLAKRLALYSTRPIFVAFDFAVFSNLFFFFFFSCKKLTINLTFFLHNCSLWSASPPHLFLVPKSFSKSLPRSPWEDLEWRYTVFHTWTKNLFQHTKICFSLSFTYTPSTKFALM